jgi:presenilin-like A22 family membrane protease
VSHSQRESTPRPALGVGLAVAVFLVVQLGALALVPDFSEAGLQATPDPADPTNTVVYVGAILVMTALMLVAFRYGGDIVVKLVILGTSGLLSWYVFAEVLPGPAAVVAAALVPVLLWVHPEWYVLDATGAVIGAAAAGVFGISFGLLPALLLLTVLAVYDAISVYQTEHMLDLAAGVMDLNIPVVLVFPLTLDYSVFDDHGAVGADSDDQAAVSADSGDEAAVAADSDDETTATSGSDGEATAADGAGEDIETDSSGDGGREVFFVGLGDAVMPTVLVASAAFFSPAPSLGVPFVSGLNLPALLGMVGTFVGLAALLRMVFAGEAHAGLPLLNGGTIAGYLLGSVASGVSLVTALGLGPYL